MDIEFNALITNGTWDLVSPAQGTNIVGSKWVFRVKRNADGSIERFKARLVAKGYHQQPGLDFTENFSPVVKANTIRLVLSLAITRQWTIRQIDIQNAFLHGQLQEEVYMQQPQGYVHPDFPHHVCRLKKSLYGLKQAPRAWFSRLIETLQQLGFVGSKADTSLFTLHQPAFSIFILIYVDDIIITGSFSTKINTFIQQLGDEFLVKDLGVLSFFLGVEALFKGPDLFLTQRKYVANLLQKVNMYEAKPCTTPMSTTCHLSKIEGADFSDPQLYRSTVGALHYLGFTRPDIAFAVHRVSKFMHQLKDPHWQAIKRILRYLKNTMDYGLHFISLSDHSLHAYSDAD